LFCRIFALTYINFVFDFLQSPEVGVGIVKSSEVGVGFVKSPEVDVSFVKSPEVGVASPGVLDLGGNCLGSNSKGSTTA
jgi:hypothetical protein